MRPLRVLLWAQAIALAAQDAAWAQGTKDRAGNIKVVAPWTRATPEGSKVAGGFMSLINTGSEADRLLGGSTRVSACLEIPETHIVNGVAMMR